jgi:hypothetical protein
MKLPVQFKKEHKWFGVSLDTKINLIGVVTLCLSIIGAVPQVVKWYKSGDLEILAPDQIELFPSSDSPSSPIGIHADMTYVNKALVDSRSLLKRESVRFDFSPTNAASRTYELRWSGYVQTKSDANGNLSPSRVDDVRPFVIRGGESIGHQTQFLPQFVPCQTNGCNKRLNFLAWDDFINVLKSKISDKTRTKLTFELMADVEGKQIPVKSNCTIILDATDVESATKNKILTRTCIK